jgi:hypothetical protein
LKIAGDEVVRSYRREVAAYIPFLRRGQANESVGNLRLLRRRRGADRSVFRLDVNVEVKIAFHTIAETFVIERIEIHPFFVCHSGSPGKELLGVRSRGMSKFPGAGFDHVSNDGGNDRRRPRLLEGGLKQCG